MSAVTRRLFLTLPAAAAAASLARPAFALSEPQQLVEKARRDVRLVPEDHHRPVGVLSEDAQAGAEGGAHPRRMVRVVDDLGSSEVDAVLDGVGVPAQHDQHPVQRRGARTVDHELQQRPAVHPQQLLRRAVYPLRQHEYAVALQRIADALRARFERVARGEINDQPPIESNRSCRRAYSSSSSLFRGSSASSSSSSLSCCSKTR